MENQPLKKILLVDDSPLALEMTAKAFENKGFKCFKAPSVARAMDILTEHIPDIILSDYEMPEINGFAFRQTLMDAPKLRNIPFVFLTAYTDQKLMTEGLDLLAVDYIDKSIPLNLIVVKINNILTAVREQHKRSMQELSIAAEALSLKSVPSVIPKVAGFNIDFLHETYQNYPGGDFIDFIPIDDDYTFILLGDVMGKKWGAWFFSFSFLSYIRSAIRFFVYERSFSLADIMQKINQVICHDPLLQNVLSTLSLISINHGNGELSYVGAGDIPLVHYQKSNNTLSPIKSTGLLLGLFQDGLYSEDRFQLQSGDQLLVISDGVIDYQDEEGIKSDYNLFLERIKPLMGEPDTLNQLKSCLFFDDSFKLQVDDCSMIFIEKI